eukprot:CAMPEP_0172531946 /NCGR_PEP_ID=MMETSP1067-20121228/5164_1 /TAXON_ID=265564 ORGANISM="Thalassiosira punctigera, Strain Tpunct2005C2" /NCGR_SAMPLE_ID=MMETSP1067 /ASSEMBLY_ACC=CAM_ASM_000444 /LENGTH=586 /DNA_ID=CAMNT_0013316389 /DNA_START=27 /DNA_END=1787 /DNA_ORIENTATION=+
MPNNKKKNKQKKKSGGAACVSVLGDGDVNLNAEVLEALNRLAETLARLDESCDDEDEDGAALESGSDGSSEGAAAKAVEKATAAKSDDGGSAEIAEFVNDGAYGGARGTTEATGLVGETAALKLDDGKAAETSAAENAAVDGTVALCPSSSSEATGSKDGAAHDGDVPSPSSTAATPEPSPARSALTPPALPLSHWRMLPLPVTSAHKLLDDGAEYIHATSTKYALVGKIDSKEGGNLAVELRKGAELIGTGALLFFSRSCGSSRSLRRYVKQSSRAVIASVVSLVRSFEDGVARGKANDGNNVAAQRTGAVWSACDSLTRSLPRGNRAAMRRELMTWVRDCNESIEEFEEVMALGPLGSDDGGGEGAEDAMMEEEQYTEKEIRVAKASVNVMKCSKNLLGLVLKTCECVGEHADILSDGTDGGKKLAEAGEGPTIQCDDETAHTQQIDDKRKGMLQWIGNLHEMGRMVGEGVTNFGILLYPPLDSSKNREKMEKWWAKKPGTATEDGYAVPILGSTALGLQLEHQLHALSECMESVHVATLPASGGSIRGLLSTEVIEATTRLRKAVRVRCREVEEAIAVWDRNA